jgi:hypothetical protein
MPCSDKPASAVAKAWLGSGKFDGDSEPSPVTVMAAVYDQKH